MSSLDQTHHTRTFIFSWGQGQMSRSKVYLGVNWLIDSPLSQTGEVKMATESHITDEQDLPETLLPDLFQIMTRAVQESEQTRQS